MKYREYIFFALLLGVFVLSGFVLQNRWGGSSHQMRTSAIPNGNELKDLSKPDLTSPAQQKEVTEEIR